jgi:hypothetical protein
MEVVAAWGTCDKLNQRRIWHLVDIYGYHSDRSPHHSFWVVEELHGFCVQREVAPAWRYRVPAPLHCINNCMRVASERSCSAITFPYLSAASPSASDTLIVSSSLKTQHHHRCCKQPGELPGSMRRQEGAVAAPNVEPYCNIYCLFLLSLRFWRVQYMGGNELEASNCN